MQLQTHPGIEKLNWAIANVWKTVFSSPEALQFSQNGMGKDKRIYALYMTQVYHYSYHAARNLALAGANLFNKNPYLMQHYFEHAHEETGHELMALHDLRALGVPINDPDSDMPPAFPANDILIGYVKHLATGPTPYKLLGYNYWIESPYQYILPFMEAMQANMGLDKKQMTFYYQHMHIDQKHGDDVAKILIKVCETEKHWTDIIEVAEHTLQLTFRLLLEIIQEYHKLVKDESKAFVIINKLAV